MFGTYSGSGLGFGLAFTLVDDFSHNARRIEREMAKLEMVATALAAKVETSMSRIRAGAGLVIGSLISLAFWVKAAKVDAEFTNYATSIETFSGSAEKAAAIMEKIQEDAIKMPRMGFAEMLDANRILMAAGVAGDQSERLVKNMSTVLVAVGRGSTELRRMGINLQQLAAGSFDGRDIKQFGYAGIDLMKLLREYTGRTNEEIKEMGITIDMVDGAFAKAASSGSKYAEAVDRVMQQNIGKMEMLRENVQYTMAAIGKSIRDNTGSFLDSLNSLMERIRTFVSNPMGAWVVRVTMWLSVMVGVLGAALIASKLLEVVTYRMAVAFTASTKVTLLKTMAERGSVAALRQMAVASGRALMASLPMIGHYAAIAGGLWIMNKAFNSADSAVAAFGVTIMFLLGKVGVFFGAIMLVYKAINAFNGVVNGGDVGSGWLGTLQRIGGMIRWVTTLFQTYDKDQRAFKVPESLLDAMDKLGIGEFARASATWIARLIEFWHGLKMGIRGTLNEVQRLIVAFYNLFVPSSEQATSFGDILERNTGRMNDWVERGKIVGQILVGVFTALVAWQGVVLAQTLATGIAMAMTGAAAMFAFSPVLTMFVLVTAAAIIFKDELKAISEWLDNMLKKLGFWVDLDMEKEQKTWGAYADYQDQRQPFQRPERMPGESTDSYLKRLGEAKAEHYARSRALESSIRISRGVDPSPTPYYFPATTAPNYVPGVPERVVEKKEVQKITIPLVLDGKVIAEYVLDQLRFTNESEY